MSTVKASRIAGGPEVGDYPPRIMGRIPSLDGLRAVAVLIVIVSHLNGGLYSFPFLGTGQISLSAPPGYLGVRIFFVISGLLITTLLLQERDKKGRISLKNFYIRRALRILPASYTYLLILSVAAGIGMLAIPREFIVASFLYFRNYHFKGGDWYTAHLWSLCVEEQFYLIWPATLVFLGKRGAIIAAFCALPVALLMHFFRPWCAFETNMDGLACGCILAGIWGPLGRNERWQRFLRSWAFWAVPVTLFALNDPRMVGNPLARVGNGAANVLIAISLERFVRYHRQAAARLLNVRAAVFVGTLSYSLYLWQEPWLKGGQTALQTFPVNVVLTFACAFSSYNLIERPFLLLKDRWRTAPK